MENTNKPLEIWKDIVGYEGYYQVSNLGRVKSLDRYSTTKRGVIKNTKGKILSLSLKKEGYLSVMLCVNSDKHRFNAHRLLAITFLPNPLNLPEVNHKNGIKSDNTIENLEWVTKSENSLHAIKNGLIFIGEKSTSSKLTEKKVLALRRLYRINPNFNKSEISKKLSVKDSTIHKIIRNQRWKHL